MRIEKEQKSNIVPSGSALITKFAFSRAEHMLFFSEKEGVSTFKELSSSS
jgi:hypothetical protein